MAKKKCCYGGYCDYQEVVKRAQKVSESTESSGYAALVDKLDEYITFLSKGLMMEAVHGGCSKKDFDTGERLRAEILELRKAT